MDKTVTTNTAPVTLKLHLQVRYCFNSIVARKLRPRHWSRRREKVLTESIKWEGHVLHHQPINQTHSSRSRKSWKLSLISSDDGQIGVGGYQGRPIWWQPLVFSIIFFFIFHETCQLQVTSIFVVESYAFFIRVSIVDWFDHKARFVLLSLELMKNVN